MYNDLVKIKKQEIEQIEKEQSQNQFHLQYLEYQNQNLEREVSYLNKENERIKSEDIKDLQTEENQMKKDIIWLCTKILLLISTIFLPLGCLAGDIILGATIEIIIQSALTIAVVGTISYTKIIPYIMKKQKLLYLNEERKNEEKIIKKLEQIKKNDQEKKEINKLNETLNENYLYKKEELNSFLKEMKELLELLNVSDDEKAIKKEAQKIYTKYKRCN